MFLRSESGGQSAHQVPTRRVAHVMKLHSFPTYLLQDYLYDLAKSIENLAPGSSDSHLAAIEVRGSSSGRFIFQSTVAPPPQSRVRALDELNVEDRTKIEVRFNVPTSNMANGSDDSSFAGFVRLC